MTDAYITLKKAAEGHLRPAEHGYTIMRLIRLREM